jgi:hypothetical protein
MNRGVKTGLLVLAAIVVLALLGYVGQRAWPGGPEGDTGPPQPVGSSGPAGRR